MFLPIDLSEFIMQNYHSLVRNPTSLIKSFFLFSAPKIANKKSTYDVPDDGSVEANLTCDANGFPSPIILWMFNNKTLNFVNTTNSNLIVMSDRRLKVMSSNPEGGFGMNVVCFANNSEGTSSRNFLVRFLKGNFKCGLCQLYCMFALFPIFNNICAHSGFFICLFFVCPLVCLFA